MGCNSCGIFGNNNDWIWIIIAIVVIMCLCGDNGLFGGSSCGDCC